MSSLMSYQPSLTNPLGGYSFGKYRKIWIPRKACGSSSNAEEMLGTGCCNLTQTLQIIVFSYGSKYSDLKYLDLIYIKIYFK